MQCWMLTRLTAVITLQHIQIIMFYTWNIQTYLILLYFIIPRR